MQDFGGHPPFAHNPHVYDGIDPESVVVTSRTVTGHEDAEPAVEPDTEPAAPVVESDEDSVDVDGDGQVSGYEVFTKTDLITECEARGLATSGNKPDLVARLQAADKAGAGE